MVVTRDRASSSSSTRRAAFEAPEDEAGVPVEKVDSRVHTLAISGGQGELGREATWDDFPNGRWGDARSPAFGEIDGYGVSLHVSIPDATRLWGYPVDTGDINKIFRRHLEGQIDAIPWSEEGLPAVRSRTCHEIAKTILVYAVHSGTFLKPVILIILNDTLDRLLAVTSIEKGIRARRVTKASIQM